MALHYKTQHARSKQLNRQYNDMTGVHAVNGLAFANDE